MGDEKQPRGASRVDDEIEVGFDRNFEARWARTETLSHLFMAVVVLAALLGLFGHGPLSHRSTWSDDGLLGVDFEPLARFGTSTQVTVHLSSQASGIAPIRAIISSEAAEPMGLQQIIPAPTQSEALDHQLGYTFQTAPGKDAAMVRFVFKPGVVGPVKLYARVGGDVVSWTQWVLP